MQGAQLLGHGGLRADAVLLDELERAVDLATATP